MPSSFFTQLGTFLKTVFAGVVALAVGVSAIVAALYIVAPQLGPREKLGAEIDHVAVSQGVEYFLYRLDEGIDRASRSPNDPADTEMGVVVLVHAKLSGYEDRSYMVRVTALDAATHKAFPPAARPEGKIVGACDDESPRAEEDGVGWRCWLVSPPRDAEYFLRVELIDNGPTNDLRDGPMDAADLLDFRDSETLTSLGPETR